MLQVCLLSARAVGGTTDGLRSQLVIEEEHCTPRACRQKRQSLAKGFFQLDVRVLIQTHGVHSDYITRRERYRSAAGTDNTLTRPLPCFRRQVPIASTESCMRM